MEPEIKFRGFKRDYKEGYFKYPNELEQYWYLLSGAEQKLLDFILRRTIGFQKLEDRISISQFVTGVGKKSNGTGVSKSQVQRSLRGLVDKGFISTERQGYQTRLVKLTLRIEEQNNQEAKKDDAAAPDHVAYLISLFRGLAPHLVDKYLIEKKQIQAMERLLKHYDSAQIEEFIQASEYASGKEYAPTISSPSELEQKLPKLRSYFSRLQSHKEDDRYGNII